MNVIRNTKSVCPVCCKPLDAEIIDEAGDIFLRRTCPEHGEYQFLLSHHGPLYADLDLFYSKVLDSTKPRGRITNFWLIATVECQKNCSYCSVETGGGRCRAMSLDELKGLIRTHGKSKLTFSGGEPTLHPNVMEFFREARASGVVTQMASNGIKLADYEFCKVLKEAGLTEVRLSMETTDLDKAMVVGTDPFVSKKFEALKNLEALDIATVLSPTIFKNENEDELINQIEYAKDKPFVHSVSVNGFSWVGRGADLDREKMIMPDEMMDVIYKRYYEGNREDIFTFQKALYALLDVVKIRLCLYTQIIIFVRQPDKVVPITEYLNMSRMRRGMKWWERFAPKNRLIRGAALAAVCVWSLSPRTITLFPALATLFMANVLGIMVSKYPSRLLPVILNTNCSPLSYDEVVGRQCMSGLVFATNEEMVYGDTSSALIEKERRRYAETDGHKETVTE